MKPDVIREGLQVCRLPKNRIARALVIAPDLPFQPDDYLENRRIHWVLRTPGAVAGKRITPCGADVKRVLRHAARKPSKVKEEGLAPLQPFDMILSWEEFPSLSIPERNAYLALLAGATRRYLLIGGLQPRFRASRLLGRSDESGFTALRDSSIPGFRLRRSYDRWLKGEWLGVWERTKRG